MLQLTHTKLFDRECLRMKGEFTAPSLAEINLVVERIFGSSENIIILDMAEVVFIDSAAIGYLVHIAENAELHNRHIKFYHINPYVKKVMEITMNTKYINEVHNADQASS